jgi:hypothetical protein
MALMLWLDGMMMMMVLIASWRLPQAQLSPQKLQSLPWPASCAVLFLTVGVIILVQNVCLLLHC